MTDHMNGTWLITENTERWFVLLNWDMQVVCGVELGQGHFVKLDWDESGLQILVIWNWNVEWPLHNTLYLVSCSHLRSPTTLQFRPLQRPDAYQRGKKLIGRRVHSFIYVYRIEIAQ